MRIVLLNQVFFPDHAATAQHAWDLARHLTRHGHEVHAIAHRSIYGTTGNALPKHEIVQGVHIYRVGRSFFGKSSILGRLADFMLFYVAASVKLLRIPKPDIVVGFTTPPFIASAGYLIARIRRAKSVYWLMDIYPDVPATLGVIRAGGLIHRVLESLNRWTMRHSDRTVVLGRCMERRVLDKGITPDKVERIGVWSGQERTESSMSEDNPYRDEWSLGDRFVVMYSGNFGLAHDVETFLEAARLLRNEDRVRFVFVGSGARFGEVEAFVAQHQLKNCVLAGYQPRERLAQSLSCADAHLVSVRSGMEGLIVPCKLFGIMAASRPSLYIGSSESEIARVLHEYDAGRVFEPGDAAGLAQAISAFSQDAASAYAMGERAADALAQAYDREAACERWRQLLHEVVGTRARAGSAAPDGAEAELPRHTKVEESAP